jgi:hypothetical protein
MAQAAAQVTDQREGPSISRWVSPPRFINSPRE